MGSDGGNGPPPLAPTALSLSSVCPRASDTAEMQDDHQDEQRGEHDTDEVQGPRTPLRPVTIGNDVFVMCFGVSW